VLVAKGHGIDKQAAVLERAAQTVKQKAHQRIARRLPTCGTEQKKRRGR
jgi:hypothetical protein